MMWQIILVAVLFVNYSSAECNVCQKNQAACINSTSFYLCFGNQDPDRSKLYHCPKGFDCTDLNAICLQTSSQRLPSCGDTSLCGLCSASRNHKFACLSRTRFQMCYGASRPTGMIGKCPAGYLCHGDSAAFCALEETVDSVTCDIVDSDSANSSPAPPFPATSTTPTTTTEDVANGMLTPTEVCERHRVMGLYPTAPLDPYCKRYIYCFNSNGIMNGRQYNCYSGTYFHIQQEKCVFNKPTYCL